MTKQQPFLIAMTSLQARKEIIFLVERESYKEMVIAKGETCFTRQNNPSVRSIQGRRVRHDGSGFRCCTFRRGRLKRV